MIDERRPSISEVEQSRARYTFMCCRCGDYWNTEYLVRTWRAPDGSQGDLYLRNGVPALSPGAVTCPGCGSGRVAIVATAHRPVRR